MTNRNMVRGVKAGARAMPEPNPAPPRPVPAPESDRAITTLEEPIDSPQPRPQIHQNKTKGLTAPDS